jgi:hypothetical protein
MMRYVPGSSSYVANASRSKGGCGMTMFVYKDDGCTARYAFPFRDLGAASAMAVRSLGQPTTMSFRLAIVTSCGRAACRRKETPMSRSIVNVIAIIVRRSGAMSLKPC